MSPFRRLFLAALVLTLGLGIVAAPASANTGLIYQTVDRDEDPYSGIYLRNGTSMDQVDRITSRYMRYGDSVELICGTDGDTLPGKFPNRRWHKVRVLEGPAKGETGWIGDRYLNTPNNANDKTPDEPECGNDAPPAEKPGGGSLYFSPYNGDDILVYSGFGPFRDEHKEYHPSPADVTLDEKVWQPDCDDANSAVPAASKLPKDKRITTLAGWSSGRNGPIMYLEAKPDGWEHINFVLLIDPGNKDAYYTGRCDNKYPDKSKTLADWLALDPNNTLMVLAGENTADYRHKVNGYAHAGIQNKLFQSIRSDSRGVRDQVVVCNYDGVNHENMWIDYKGKMNKPGRSCPGDPDKRWNP